MKLDPLEVIESAMRTLLGRILSSAFVAHSGVGIGASLGSTSPISVGNFLEFFALTIPLLTISLLTPLTFFVSPMLLGFTILFTRFEWDFKLLPIPFLLSVYAGFILAS